MRTSTDEDFAISAVIGANIRNKRKLSELSVQDLAAEVGVSYQQIQKYEGGTNRVSAPMLFRLAKFFGTTTDSFFKEVSNA